MAPRDPKVVSYTMSHIRGKNTGLELAMRKALSDRGIHYRLYSPRVYGHPDICIQNLKIAVFCDSEFWHGYRFEENQAKILTHRSYWIPKIERNIARDQEVNRTLASQGYLVLRYWGREIENELPRVADEICAAISQRKRLLDWRKQIRLFTTLAYIEKDGSFLLLHRTKKKNDFNEGKWIGVGGKLEPGETMVQAMKREIKEETGLQVEGYAYYGKIDFLNDSCPAERMYLFKVTSFSGDERECDEGDLAWVKKEEMDKLPMWEGDKAFLPLLEKEAKIPFRMTLIYKGGRLKEVLGPYYEAPTKKKAKKKRGK